MAEKKDSAKAHRFWDLVAEAKKNPHFRKEIHAFIRASTSVYKLE
ncbi:MAG: hypothetical protein AABW68_03355 [archaeon]